MRMTQQLKGVCVLPRCLHHDAWRLRYALDIDHHVLSDALAD
jgi:hypothetical protein